MDSSLRLGCGPVTEKGARDGKSLMKGCHGDDKRTYYKQEPAAGASEAGQCRGAGSSTVLKEFQAREAVSPVPAAGFRPHVSAPT